MSPVVAPYGTTVRETEGYYIVEAVFAGLRLAWWINYVGALQTWAIGEFLEIPSRHYYLADLARECDNMVPRST